MNAGEALTLLTKAALVDPRMKRTDPVEWADMAGAWADVLDDVSLEVAADALRRVQRDRRGTQAPILPGDILAEVDEPIASVLGIPDRTEEIGMRRALSEVGVSEASYRANKHDPVWMAGLVEKLRRMRELEA